VKTSVSLGSNSLLLALKVLWFWLLPCNFAAFYPLSPTFLFLSDGQQPLSVTHHFVSGFWNQLPKELRSPVVYCVQMTKTYHSYLISHVSSSFPSSQLSPYITPSLFHYTSSKPIFSTNPFLLSFSTFPPHGLTPWTLAVFHFSRACRF